MALAQPLVAFIGHIALEPCNTATGQGDTAYYITGNSINAAVAAYRASRDKPVAQKREPNEELFPDGIDVRLVGAIENRHALTYSGPFQNAINISDVRTCVESTNDQPPLERIRYVQP